MKMYVSGHDYRPEYKLDIAAGKAIPDEDNRDILYTVQPKWMFPLKYLAEDEMTILHQWRVHKGDHYCRLEVEQVGDEFAIVCNHHPEPIETGLER